MTLRLYFAAAAAFIGCLQAAAQTSPDSYSALDPNDPVEFHGSYIVYGGERITLSEKAFFIDGRFSVEEASAQPYVYNSVNEAAKHLTPGSFEDPMVLYIAPWVYWIDDPDDPTIRQKPDVNGLEIDCPGLRFYGLNKDPYNVVMCCNRGQTMGSNGNFTLFQLKGDGITAENVTFANYCNIDLVYPLNPSLNREKRGSAIVQAQLIYSPGDKIFARNCNFLSRLNLMPFLGAKRLLFDRCHFESTDDALSTGIYLNCSFEFHNKKPFGGTSGTGAVLLNADIRSFSTGDQYFTKMGGPLTVIDSKIEGNYANYVGWRDFPTVETRNYQYNFFFNGESYTIGERNACSTIELYGKSLLDAFRYEYQGDIFYNVYNLTCGKDGWDPMKLKDQTLSHEKALGRKLIGIPTQLVLSPTRRTVETGKDSIELTATANFFYGGACETDDFSWSVADGKKDLVRLEANGGKCTVIPSNDGDSPVDVTVVVRNSYGAEAASVLTVKPSKLPAPGFASKPRMSVKSGQVRVDYRLDCKLADQSLVSWYRCDDQNGSNPVLVAVSRMDKPLKAYALQPSDAGKYMKCIIEPKHSRCELGAPVELVMDKVVNASDISADAYSYYTDFVNLPLENRKAGPGEWSFLNAVASMEKLSSAEAGERDAHKFGPGEDGAAGFQGLMQSGQSLMYYTPFSDEKFSHTALKMTVRPFKFEGQGFSMAWCWMDVLLDFNPEILSGYGVRFIRTTKFHDAIDCVFIRYENGDIKEISEPVSTGAYRPVCDIAMEIDNGKLTFSMKSDASYSVSAGAVKNVEMQTNVVPEGKGGVAVMYAGGAYTMINSLHIVW